MSDITTAAPAQEPTAPAAVQATQAAPQPTAAAEQAAQAQAPAAQAPAGAPEAYADFTAPEGVQLDALAGDFKALAKELNLPQDQAQRVVDLSSKLVQQAQQSQQATVQAAHEQWRERSRSDKEFGGPKFEENLARAKSTLDAVATPELKHLLAATGLGEHPEVIRHFLKIAPTYLPDTHVPGGMSPGGARSREQVLYDQSSN
jgi:hypothetical protein